MKGKEQILQIFEDSMCLRPDQLEGYLLDALSPEETRVVELHLATCQLCNDALDGIQNYQLSGQRIPELSLPVLPTATNLGTEIKGTEKGLENNSNIRKKLSGLALPQTTFSPKLEPNLRNHRNLSWLGGLGVVALFAAGGFLFWKYQGTTPKVRFFDLQRNNLGSLSAAPEKMSGNSSATSTPLDRADSATLLPGNKETAVAETDFESKDSGDHPGKLQVPGKTATENNEKGVAAVPLGKNVNGYELKGQQNNADKTPHSETLSVAIQHPESSKMTAVPSRNINQEAASTISALGDSVTNPKKTELGNLRTSVSTPAAVNTAPSNYEIGQQFYKNQQYDKAVTYLKAAMKNKSDPNYWNAVYFSALSNLAMGKTGKGKRQLKEIVRAKNGLSDTAAKRLDELK